MLLGLVMLFGGAAVIVITLIPANPEPLAREISRAQGIAIDYGEPARFRLANSEQNSIVPADMTASPTDPEHAAAALTGLQKAMRVYPPGFVAKLLRAVFITGALQARTTRATGTIGDGWMIVAAPLDRSPAVVREVSEITFHHELSSAVLRQSQMFGRWKELWPSARAEIHEYYELARKPDEIDPDPATGLLSSYAATNSENDFNVYAERAFADGKSLARLARTHELVETKVRLMIAIYAAVDPRAVQMFRDLNLTER